MICGPPSLIKTTVFHYDQAEGLLDRFAIGEIELDWPDGVLYILAFSREAWGWWWIELRFCLSFVGERREVSLTEDAVDKLVAYAAVGAGGEDYVAGSRRSLESYGMYPIRAQAGFVEVLRS